MKSIDFLNTNTQTLVHTLYVRPAFHFISFVVYYPATFCCAFLFVSTFHSRLCNEFCLSVSTPNVLVWSV